MRIPTILLLFTLISSPAIAQHEDLGWIAPEGKIINYRTLTWDDFQQNEDKAHAASLASRNLQAQAYVIPAIYCEPYDGKRQENGRIKFKFKVKCAFQSHAFVRQSTRQAHSNYVLFHEQGHYDIALTYAYRMQAVLSSQDYSEQNYSGEIEKIYHDMHAQYNRTQEVYDAEVNPEGRDDIPKQTLWDMRVKKALENVSETYFTSTEGVAQTVKQWGQTVKRIPGEDTRRFATRARPLYSEYRDKDAAVSIECDGWAAEKSVIAFYLQRYFIEEQDKPTIDASRLLAYMFVPNGQNTYKRVFIDSFCFEDKAPDINAVFFANADSDNVRELVIQTTQTFKDRQRTGTRYATTVYDNFNRALPAKLKKLSDVSARLENGFEGTEGGKATKAKYKNEKDLTKALAELGYPGTLQSAPEKVIHR